MGCLPLGTLVTVLDVGVFMGAKTAPLTLNLSRSAVLLNKNAVYTIQPDLYSTP